MDLEDSLWSALKERNHNRGSPSAGRELNVQDISVYIDTDKFDWAWTCLCNKTATVIQYKLLQIYWKHFKVKFSTTEVIKFPLY